MRSGVPLVLLSAILFAQQTQNLPLESPETSNAFAEQGTRWAVVVGISSYQHLPPGAQLQFAHRDAEDFAAFLRDTNGGGIPSSHIKLLGNEQATLAAIRAALNDWLVHSTGPEDVVYFFFAGHAVVAERDQPYFVAHDSDPQNLHATALSFEEVDRTLSNRLRAGLVVLVADACHAGHLGWSSYSPDAPSQAAEPLVKIGRGDRSFLKLLASRPSEKSFEDQRWNGGHGVFTYALLQGLRGEADADGDHVVRASETIDYVARLVPEQTGSQQHPRIAGTFDARAVLALAPGSAPETRGTVTLDVSGPATSAVYLDNAFRGRIRPNASLRVEGMTPGQHHIEADFPNGSTLDGSIKLSSLPAQVTLRPPAPGPIAQLRSRLDGGHILERDGAWDVYQNQRFPASEKASADALMSRGLEELGQACVSDYVQSTAVTLKRAMLGRAVEAYERLQTIHPNDPAIEVRKVFCRGRMQIADAQFSEAVVSLQESLRRDPQFACAYNALGVALSRLNRKKEARAAFETAASLTPEWALPPFQIGSQLIASGDLEKALPYLEKAVAYNPRSTNMRWSLMRLYRQLGRLAEVERQAAGLIQLDPNYAPAYLELGMAYDAVRNFAKAADAYDTYVLLAPNFADTNAVRTRADAIRPRVKKANANDGFSR